MASTPRCAAAAISSSRVIPQTFILTRKSSLHFRGSPKIIRKQCTHRYGNLELRGIFHRRKAQAFRWRGHPAQAAVTAVQYFPRPVRLALAFTHSYEHAGDVAHHVMQEAVRQSVYENAFAIAAHVETPERAHRLLGLAFHGAERGEVMPAEEIGCRDLHTRFVQRPVHPRQMLA